MSLIKSISGIRGTIGGKPDTGLTPVDIVKYTSAYATLVKEKGHNTVVIGRDGRISGPIVESLVIATLQSMGIEVINLGLSTTPTVEMAVKYASAGGGIILTASHNPKQWNALKLLDETGEFISAAVGQKVLDLGNANDFTFSEVDDLGTVTINTEYKQRHFDDILAHDLVDKVAIAKKGFKVVVDGINSSGAEYVPDLLKQLGVTDIIVLNGEMNGDFAHNPEPLPAHLTEMTSVIKKENADLGIVVDPDVDRLAFVNEDGTMFGEEYTLVAVADYILQHKKGNSVSNLSSTRALRDVTEKHGGQYFASAVGEVNVVNMMKENNAVIGGEGNGGIIVPELHYGRDALIGIALFMSHLAKFTGTMSELRASYPNYFISKNKIELTPDIDVDTILVQMAKKYKNENVNTIDGVKIDFAEEWVHLRKSNTEPIIRIYSESASEEKANALAEKIMEEIQAL